MATEINDSDILAGPPADGDYLLLTKADGTEFIRWPWSILKDLLFIADATYEADGTEGNVLVLEDYPELEEVEGKTIALLLRSGTPFNKVVSAPGTDEYIYPGTEIEFLVDLVAGEKIFILYRKA